ncbi:hypothetical protein, partial [Pseudoalteromonas undina]
FSSDSFTAHSLLFVQIFLSELFTKRLRGAALLEINTFGSFTIERTLNTGAFRKSILPPKSNH